MSTSLNYHFQHKYLYKVRLILNWFKIINPHYKTVNAINDLLNIDRTEHYKAVFPDFFFVSLESLHPYQALRIFGGTPSRFFKNIFLVCPIWLPIFFSLQLLNEPGLGEGIDPGMALTPFTSSIVLDEIRTHTLLFRTRKAIFNFFVLILPHFFFFLLIHECRWPKHFLFPLLYFWICLKSILNMMLVIKNEEIWAKNL